MTGNEFLEAFADLIQTDSEIDMDTSLSSLEEWDSMGMMAVVAYFDVTHQKAVSFEDLERMKTVGDVARLVPGLEC